MPLRIPSELKIGGHEYKVILDRGQSMEPSAAGLTNYERNVIALDASLPESQLEVTLFHEIFHAINGELEHALLESLSQQLYQVFHDNHLLNDSEIVTTRKKVRGANLS